MVELQPIQEKTLKLFTKSPLKNKFYWTGGTLLSFLYLHHRQSQDLDFFSDKPFQYEEVRDFIRVLEKELNLDKVEKNKIYDRWDFFLQNKQKLRIEFVLYEFPKIKPRKKWQGIYVDSLDDIATNKTMTLFDRNDPKDLVDLYFLLTEKKYKVIILLKWAEKKFGLRVDEGSFWSEGLKTFRDLEKVRPLLIAENKAKQEQLIDEIKEYFVSRSADYLRRVLE